MSDESSNAPAPESGEQGGVEQAPPSAIERRMQEVETQERLKAGAPKPPSHDPAPGLMHVYDEKTGVWMVRRDPDYREPGEPEPAKTEPAAEKEGQEQEPKSAVELPDTLPDYIRDNPEIQTLVADGAAAMTSGGEYNDEAVQRAVDLIAQFELEIGAEQPDLHDESRIRSMLKGRWGEAYEGRLAEVNKYVNARPALRAYLNRTGAGNQLSVLEALGMIACGAMALTPAKAAELMEAARKDPNSHLRNPYHKNHKLVVQQAKVWADIIDRGEKFKAKEASGRQGNVKEMVANRLDAERKAKGETLDDATEKIDSELKQLRLDPAYFDSSKPNHKAVVARVRELYRQRYPD